METAKERLQACEIYSQRVTALLIERAGELMDDAPELMAVKDRKEFEYAIKDMCADMFYATNSYLREHVALFDGMERSDTARELTTVGY